MQNGNHISRNEIIDEAISSFKEKVLCCKFDIATSIGYDINNGYNPDLFKYGTSVHPNENGNIELYKRVKIDCPDLFDDILE